MAMEKNKSISSKPDQSNRNKNRIAIVLVLILICSLLTTTTACSSSKSSGTVSIELSGMKDYAQQIKNDYTATIKENLSHRLEWDYGGDLINQDFSTEDKLIDQQATQYFIHQINQLVGPRLYHSEIDVTLYNRSYQAVREGKLNFEAAFECESENIKAIDIRVYVKAKKDETFYDDFDKKISVRSVLMDEFEKVSSDIVSLTQRSDIHLNVQIIGLAADKVHLPLNEFAKLNQNQRWLWMNDSGSYLCIQQFDSYPEFWPVSSLSQRTSNTWYYFYPNALKLLEEKYNEPFVQLGVSMNPINHTGYETFAPKRDLTLTFGLQPSEDYFTDFYTSVVTQRKISERVNQIIDELGYTDRAVQFNAFNDSGFGFEVPIDFVNSTDVEILESGLGPKMSDGTRRQCIYAIAIYVMQEEKYPDGDIIFEISKKLTETYGNAPQINGYGFIYRVPEKKQKIIAHLFRKQKSALNHRYSNRSSQDAFQGVDVFRTEEEFFFALDAYGKQIEQYLGIDRIKPGISRETFMMTYRSDDVLR